MTSVDFRGRVERRSFDLRVLTAAADPELIPIARLRGDKRRRRPSKEVGRGPDQERVSR